MQFDQKSQNIVLMFEFCTQYIVISYRQNTTISCVHKYKRSKRNENH